MNVTEWEEALARDPLSRRLSRIEHRPASAELMARVLSGAHVLRTRRLRGRHLLLAAAGVVLALSTVAASPAGGIIGRAVTQRFGGMVAAPEVIPAPRPSDCAIYLGPSGMSPDTTITRFTQDGVTFTKYTRKCKDGHTITMIGSTPTVLDLQQAQSLVGFRIRTPSWVAHGLQLGGVQMTRRYPDLSTYRDEVTLNYQPAVGSAGPGVSIDEQPGTPVGGSAVPRSSVHKVRVNGHPAYYTHGTYEPYSNGQPTRWNPNADREELSWQTDGLTFNIEASGLSESEMIRIAESIR